MKEITSSKNNLIVQVKKLKGKKYREASGAFIVEGYRNVVDSIKFSEPLHVFVTDEAYAFDAPVYKVSDRVFEELSDTKTPQGVLAVFKLPEFCGQNISGRIALLNGVSDPGNVGTILRTSVATGFNTVVLDENCADVFSPKVVRSAMSAVFSLNILRACRLGSFIREYNAYTYYASALTNSSQSLFELNFAEKSALIFGSEANGIEADILSKADIIYKIPMEAGIESLNVAVAASVSQYEVYKQR